MTHTAYWMRVRPLAEVKNSEHATTRWLIIVAMLNRRTAMTRQEIAAAFVDAGVTTPKNAARLVRQTNLTRAPFVEVSPGLFGLDEADCDVDLALFYLRDQSLDPRLPSR
jgi:hypothetical protein